jgi:hypothetical protein
VRDEAGRAPRHRDQIVVHDAQMQALQVRHIARNVHREDLAAAIGVFFDRYMNPSTERQQLVAPSPSRTIDSPADKRLSAMGSDLIARMSSSQSAMPAPSFLMSALVRSMFVSEEERTRLLAAGGSVMHSQPSARDDEPMMAGM